LVQTVPKAGTAPTSALGKATDKTGDAFERAKVTIAAVGRSTVDVIDRPAAS
jgi:hypothetical protein